MRTREFDLCSFCMCSLMAESFSKVSLQPLLLQTKTGDHLTAQSFLKLYHKDHTVFLLSAVFQSEQEESVARL